MKFTVRCQSCRDTIAVCGNAMDAADVWSRHYRLLGHDAEVERKLDTPFEGLL